MTSNDHADCWSCAGSRHKKDLIKLTAHPEVLVCLDCTVAVKRRGDERRAKVYPTPLDKARKNVRQVLVTSRIVVAAQDWNRYPVAGPVLRRLDRYMPR